MFRLLCVAAVVAASLGGCSRLPAEARAPVERPRNVILLVADGMGDAHVKAFRTFADDEATPGIELLDFERHRVGSVATDSLPSPCNDLRRGPDCRLDPYGVTDSAASATAYATGFDSVNGAIGVNEIGAPMETVLELAAKQGMATGLVSTSQITHATPASFAAHVRSRREYAAIADQLFDNQHEGLPMAQVLLGGGIRDLRRDDRDLVSEFVAAGYEFVEDVEGMNAAAGDRLLGLFAPIGLPRAWDRPESVPSLLDMTRKALDVLNRDPDGFFLLIEGSQVDWSAHGHDIAGVVSEMSDFVPTIDAVLAFAEEAGDTLVVITADHETGGLSLARDGDYRWDPRPLRGLRSTPAQWVEAFLTGEDTLTTIVAASVPFELTEAERAALDAVPADAGQAYDLATALLDQRTRTGWSTDGHTAVDVPLYAFGPGSDAFGGVMQNEMVGRALMDAVRR